MAYVNLYTPSSTVSIRQLVRIGSFTYVIGWIYVSSETVSNQFYMAKLGSDGTMVWQKRYIFPDTVVSGSTWTKTHFTDLVELTKTGELMLLGADDQNLLLVKLKDDGSLIWVKKLYDKRDTRPLYTHLSMRGRLFKLDDSRLLVKITETHSQNGGVQQIDHKFMSINPEGKLLNTKQISSNNPLLIIRDEEVREGSLIMFGYSNGEASILTLNANLNIVQSSALYYNGELQGYNYLHIYAASPVFEGSYSVLGSFYHYDPSQKKTVAREKEDKLSFILNEGKDQRIPRLVLEFLQDYTEPLPSRFTRFFTAEITEDHKSVGNEKLLDKDFTATYQNIHQNTEGLFFGVYHQLYKCNSGLTDTDWVKNIQASELSSPYLLLNKSIGNSFEAYTLRGSGGKYAVASIGLDYESCKSEPVDENVQLTPQNFAIRSIDIPIKEFSPREYATPSIDVVTIENGMEELCASAPQPDLKQSTITANPTSIAADGTATSQITVTLKDAQGNTINPSSYTVQINTNAGTWTGGITTTGNGIYKRELRSSTTQQTASVGFSVSGIGTSPHTAAVQFTREGVSIPIKDGLTSLQSPYLYLQAAGSDGSDSTKGRHLRWTLRGILGERHLPKGDYAVSSVNFNKPKDYVKIYKAAYAKKVIRFDFAKQYPAVVDDNNHLWIYRPGNKEFYIHFINTTKYNQVRQSINPLESPAEFMESYGSEPLEVENIKEPFFAVSCKFTSVSSSAQFKVETLSVSTTEINAIKVVSNRKTIAGTQLNNPLNFLMENGRAVRWQISNARLAFIDFEFYEDTIQEVNNTTGWMEMGDFALTKKDAVAFNQLEPSAGDVNGVWHRFNAEGLVNTDNYKDKWNATPEQGDRNIRQVVDKYIQLSENANNFAAIEDVSLGNNPSDPEDYMEISNLDMLNFSANDYHIARMLGLGVLDKESDPSTNQWMYVAEYYTTANLEDGQGERDVQHLFMSLPTANTDFRLPRAIDLDHIAPGVFLDGEDGNNTSLTDDDGYTYDGISRYVSLYAEELLEDDINSPFFVSNAEVNLSVITTPVYGGLKYRINSGDWVQPELSNDPRYYNLLPSGNEKFYETRFILIPEPQRSYYVHKQSASGIHRYKSYGINWFSRAEISQLELSIETLIKQKNPLVPPSNTNALLVREENPLFLTSQEEQQRLDAISSDDNTLIRLTYDYHSGHELKNYNVPVDSPYSNQQLVSQINNPQVLFPDDEEVFAEEVDIFFRNQMPNNVTGKALSVSNHNSNEILSIITTGDYEIVTTGETITPSVPSGAEANYVGGVFVSGNNQYIIHEVTQGSQGPVFTVYKKEISDSIVNSGGTPSTPPIGELELPVLVTDGLFMAIENMQTPASWGTPNPLSFKVQVGNNWNIHREVIKTIDDNGDAQRMVEKTRGIWKNVAISLDTQAGQEGVYKITFANFSLAQHPQYTSNGVSAEWYKGIVRIFTENTVSGIVPKKTRKVLPVVKIENIGTSNDLVLYVQDPSYSSDTGYDSIQTGTGISVNFYPGYKIYLYENAAFGLTNQDLLPAEGEGVRYSIFGFRSHDTVEDYLSKMGVPTPMFAQEIVEALPPEQPEGALYATRPDFFGRSTYSLATEYQHKPHGVVFYRSNDEALLNVLYKKTTVRSIRESLAVLGGNDEEYLSNRWQNFLNFGELVSDGDFTTYPPAGVSPEGYKFPNPDKQAFFDWVNQILADLGQPTITDPPGSLTVGDPKIIGFVKGAIYNAFVSLTEMPILYQYLKGGNYKPVDKSQVIKDRNGNTLPPGSPDFEMGPMMKVTGTSPHKTLFTDFKLDGTSNNLYFYGVKELSTQMRMSDFSPFLGPIKLVNTNAPEAPEIKRIIPVLENIVLGILPKIQLEINAFPEVQQVRKITIYRSLTMLKAQSVLSMQLVKVVDLEAEGILDNHVWTITDDFSDLPEIPYGDGLFYRVKVSRKVEYAEQDGTVVTEYAPSQASKIVASMMVESNPPTSPVLIYTATPPDTNDEIHSVVLEWPKTAYNAKYHVYKMNAQGNWTKIHQLQSNDDDITLPLADTDLQSGTLKLTNNEGNPRYHHFKVITENTVGMLSTEEKILTIPD
ncbi:Ig-like domain-containing protein [Mesonia ostreae]|uniref:Ig-like domain-containing protein n=2 Tax=Mesonia ostreae TaxID=861110 RepID=A0ABU2KJH7_9FLAO|nr:Ig-like domain-containing protein [Mesonia ostreae]MDT0294834.1 Ig-like domain-containing protein [Mesonia ostreae]